MDAVRTCVGCRSRAPRASLLRLVTHSLEVRPDPSARLPGRGAWLHPTLDCFELAVKRRAFGRAFGIRENLDAASLGEFLRASDSPVIGASLGGGRSFNQEQAERHVN